MPYRDTPVKAPRRRSDGLNPRPRVVVRAYVCSCVTRQSTNSETVRQSNYCNIRGDRYGIHASPRTNAASRLTKPGTFAKGRQRTRFMIAKSPHNGRGPPPHARLRNFFLYQNRPDSPCFDHGRGVVGSIWSKSPTISVSFRVDPPWEGVADHLGGVVRSIHTATESEEESW